jgi:hypothetical protein
MEKLFVPCVVGGVLAPQTIVTPHERRGRQPRAVQQPHEEAHGSQPAAT